MAVDNGRPPSMEPTPSTPSTTGGSSPSTYPPHTMGNGGSGSSSGRGVVDQAQDIVGQVADQARQQAKTQLGTQKVHAAEGLGSVAHAVTAVGQQLREQDRGALAQYTDQFAEQLEGFSRYLREKDIDDLVDDAQQLARRQPALFLGGAFALGVLAARLLKTSSPSSGMSESDNWSRRRTETMRYGSPTRGYVSSPSRDTGTWRAPSTSAPSTTQHGPSSATPGQSTSPSTSTPTTNPSTWSQPATGSTPGVIRPSTGTTGNSGTSSGTGLSGSTGQSSSPTPQPITTPERGSSTPTERPRDPLSPGQ